MNYFLMSIIFGLAWYVYSIKKKQSISSQLDRRIEIKVAVASDYSVSGDKDAWDPVPEDPYILSGLRKALIGINLHIRFQDLEGQITQRDISTVWYAYNPTTGDGLVYAYCHMRQANRPFVFKRIQHAVSVETGEIIPNLGEYLDSLYGKTSHAAVERFLTDHSAAILILISFAKADGAMRARERSTIMSWAAKLGMTGQQDLDELEGQIKGWYRTDHAFWDAVKTLEKEARSPHYLSDVWQAVITIVQSDKTIADQEMRYLKYAANRLGQTMPQMLPTKNTKS